MHGASLWHLYALLFTHRRLERVMKCRHTKQCLKAVNVGMVDWQKTISLKSFLSYTQYIFDQLCDTAPSYMYTPWRRWEGICYVSNHSCTTVMRPVSWSEGSTCWLNYQESHLWVTYERTEEDCLAKIIESYTENWWTDEKYNMHIWTRNDTYGCMCDVISKSIHSGYMHMCDISVKRCKYSYWLSSYYTGSLINGWAKV